ncbi:MAG TPA: ATP-binding protein [Gemmatales bacterium]|nr:ATP-binding protein [Gemmatales bacterium]
MLHLESQEIQDGLVPQSDDADGRTLFDSPQTSEDGTVLAVFPQNTFDRWNTQALVHIESSDKRTYLAQVVKGPFAAPVGIQAQAQPLVISQIENALFTPPYHGWVALEILTEIKDGQKIVPLFRPRPNSPVKLLSTKDTQEALACDGDLRLGRAVGYDGVGVGLKSTEKHHVPRHTLVVGTTGAGKSTFLAGWIERLSQAGFCVLLLDVEGEYASLHRAAASANILPALQQWGLEPAGLPNNYLLVPTDLNPSDSTHPAIRRFSIEFANISPHVASELLQGNEAQTERFLAAYDAACELYFQTLPDDRRKTHEELLRNWDDQEDGYPGLRLGHVLDMAEAVAEVVGNGEIQERFLHDDGFKHEVDRLRQKAADVKRKHTNVASWRKTVSLLAKLYRSRLFDRHDSIAADGRKITSLNYVNMLKPGHVVIFDVAAVDNPTHRNLAIADVLRGVAAAQDQLYDAAAAGQKPKTVIIIEEAHEFVGAGRARQLPMVMEQLQRIARRGRKRWLGLTFASQFPGHLPNELYSLCNNKVLLKIADEPTLTQLKKSVGGVPESLWTRLKHLPPGQAIVSAQGIDPALLVQLEPGRGMLQMVD